MTFDWSAFSTYAAHDAKINIGTLETAPVVRIGSAVLGVWVNGLTGRVELTKVLHLPTFKFQLVSVPRFASLGVVVSFTQGKFSHISDAVTFATGSTTRRLYRLYMCASPDTTGSSRHPSTDTVYASLVTAASSSEPPAGASFGAPLPWAWLVPTPASGGLRTGLHLWHERLALVPPLQFNPWRGIVL